MMKRTVPVGSLPEPVGRSHSPRLSISQPKVRFKFRVVIESVVPFRLEMHQGDSKKDPRCGRLVRLSSF